MGVILFAGETGSRSRGRQGSAGEKSSEEEKKKDESTTMVMPAMKVYYF
jgi:hypothetical protein